MGRGADLLTVQESADGWTVAGEIDASTAPAFDEAMSDLPTGDGPIVLDLSGVSFIDSSGLRVLISLAGRASDEGRSVALRDPSPTVARLLEITGLAEMFGSGTDETTTA
jgi:anti-sigma B factor antagonist